MVTQPSPPTGVGSETAPRRTAVVETAATETAAETRAATDSDTSGKQFRFNPPIHGSSLSVRPMMSTGSRTANRNATSDFYDEDVRLDYRKRYASDGLNTLRLGRIIMHDKSPGPASTLKNRWGFRFLYNPSSITTRSDRNDSFVIDPRQETNVVITGVAQNFQTINFKVLLDRVPDVNSGIPDRGAYFPSISPEDRRGILRYGTHYDLEALYKVCNGEWNLTDRGKTSDMGVLMPSNARLILGPHVNFFGFVMSVSWQDMMFGKDMIPIRTSVDISFRRHVDMTADEAKQSFPNIARDEELPTGGGSSGGSSDDVGNVEDTDTGGGGTDRVDRLMPSGYRNGRSPAAAVAYGLTRVGKDAEDNRYCLRWVGRQVFDRPWDGRSIDYAYQVWANAPSRVKYPRDWGAPRGSIVLWSSAIGGGAGHIGISLGNGKMLSTAPGGIQVLSIKGYSDRAYYGWMPPIFRSRPWS